MSKWLASFEQVVNKLYTRASHELLELLKIVVLLDLLELKTSIMGVGGWLRISLIIRLSQPPA